MELTDLLPALRAWLSTVTIPAQVLNDDPERLRVIFETENALAELIAGDGAYTPYRFVSFTVLDTRLALDAEPVFCDYDGEDSSIEDILRALDRGMDCAAAL